MNGIEKLDADQISKMANIINKHKDLSDYWKFELVRMFINEGLDPDSLSLAAALTNNKAGWDVVDDLHACFDLDIDDHWIYLMKCFRH